MIFSSSGAGFQPASSKGFLPGNLVSSRGKDAARTRRQDACATISILVCQSRNPTYLRGVVKWFFNFLLFAWLAAGSAHAQLTLADVQTVVAQAVTRATALAGSPLKTNAVIAVTDREGWVLGVWALNTNATSASPLVADAIAKAGTAAFLSSGQNAFSTRTAGFIVQQHFPPGVNNKPPVPLVGVYFSQLGFSDINKFKAPGSVISYG